MDSRNDSSRTDWAVFEERLRAIEEPALPEGLLARCLAPAESSPALGEERPLVLVVDDEPHIRRLIRIHLERMGCAVVEAADGEAALSRLPALHPDLILLDVMMPGPSGFEVVERIKADPRTAAVPVVMLTARDEYDDIRRGWSKGADCYFSKPFNPWELCETVRRMLAVRGTPDEPAPLRPWLK